jgi:hypothetical protein
MFSVVYCGCATGLIGCLYFFCCPTEGYHVNGVGNCSASCLVAGDLSSGLLSRAHNKSLKMNSRWRSSTARLESTQRKLDFIYRHFKISMAISVVQICVLTALALMPTNNFTSLSVSGSLRNSSIYQLSL